jgi:hypothetical protein
MSFEPASDANTPAARTAGSISDVIEAAIQERNRGNWEAALSGLDQARRAFGKQTPRAVHAQAATCLHKLGRYAEAEQVAREGLGPQHALIALKGTVPTEKELLRRWPRSTPPFVSILCITYNHARYIDDTIRGFLAQQTPFPFEILIHDDASTDQTAELVRQWQRKCPSIIRTVLQTENQFSRGVCPLDLLLRQARGQYVATCEGDDYWIEPSKLARQVAFLEKHPEFSCSAHNYFLYDEAQLSIRPWFEPKRDALLSERQVMNLTRLLWLPTLVFRKTFTQFPAERAFAATGDFVLSSYLGTFGRCAYFDTFLGAVRRQNQFSFWTPLDEEKKNYCRVKTWVAIMRMHENLGHHEVAADLLQKIKANPLSESTKSELIQQSLELLKLQPANVTDE